MLKRSTPKSYKNLLLATMAALVFMTSCHKDDPKPAELIVNLKTPSAFLVDGEVKGYVILSDENGKALATGQMVNGQTTQIKPATAYTGKTFMLTEFYIYQGATKTVNAHTVTSMPVKTMDWAPVFSDNNGQDNSGEFIFQNNAASVSYFGANTSDNFGVYNYSPNTMDIQMKTNATKLFITSHLNGANGKYHFYDNSGKGYTPDNTTAYPIDLSLVTSSLVAKSVTIPDEFSSSAFVSVKGQIKSGNFAGLYSLDTSYPIQGKINYEVPDQGFDEYWFGTEFSKNNGSYYNTSLTAADFTPISLKYSSAAPTSNSVKITTVGTYDVATVGFEDSKSNNYWGLNFPSGDGERTFTLPEVPADITAQIGTVDLTKLAYTVFEAEDVKTLSNYSDFLDLIPKVAAGEDFDALEDKTVNFYVSNGTSGGRAATSKHHTLFNH